MNFLKRVKIIRFIYRRGMLSIATIVLIILPILSYGQNYQCQWAHVAGNTAVVTISSQAVNSSGNVYVAGNYLDGGLSFDNNTTILNPNPDTTSNKPFIVKYDSEGNLLWSKSFESGDDASNPIITIDNQDNIYLTGLFSDYITFGALTLTQNPVNSGGTKFIAKFDSSGNVLWAQQAPSSINYKVSHDGHVALYGELLGSSVTLGANTALTNSDSSGQSTDFLIGELDNNGNLLWAKSGGVSGENEEIDDVAFTQNDQIYVSGLFESTLTLGEITLNSIGNTSWDVKDWFIARYDINGNVSWAIRGGVCHIAPLQLKDGAPMIKTDHNNNLYFVGNFHDPAMQADSLILSGNGTLSGSVVDNTVDEYWYAGMCNKKGLLWVESGNSPIYHIHFIPANDGGLYLAGTFRDTATFGNIQLVGSGNQDLDGFVVKLDNYGQTSWAKHFGPLLQGPQIFDIVVDQHNTLDILGAYGDRHGIIPNITLNFDSLSLISVNASRDYFLARYKDNGDILSASNIGSPGVDGLTSGQLNLVGKSGLYVSGVYSAAPLTLDTITVNFPVPNQDNYFVAKYAEKESATGINTVKVLNSLKIFPNPTTGTLFLRSPEGFNNICIFNVTGQEVYHKALPVDQKEYTLNLNRLSDGIYWLKIENKGESVIGKIVLSK